MSAISSLTFCCREGSSYPRTGTKTTAGSSLSILPHHRYQAEHNCSLPVPGYERSFINNLISDPGAIHRCAPNPWSSLPISPAALGDRSSIQQVLSGQITDYSNQQRTNTSQRTDVEKMPRLERSKDLIKSKHKSSRQRESTSRSKRKCLSQTDIESPPVLLKRARIDVLQTKTEIVSTSTAEKVAGSSAEDSILISDEDDADKIRSSAAIASTGSARTQREMLRANNGYSISPKIRGEASGSVGVTSFNDVPPHETKPDLRAIEMRDEMKAVRDEINLLYEERDELREKLINFTKLQTEHASLKRDREQSQREQERRQAEHTEALKTIMMKNDELHRQLQAIRSQNEQLKQEARVDTLGQSTYPLPSPAPSSQSSSLNLLDEEQKEANVRSVYIKTKRQYDILHASATNLATCTRSMDLNSFGDFGQYMKKLRECLN